MRRKGDKDLRAKTIWLCRESLKVAVLTVRVEATGLRTSNFLDDEVKIGLLCIQLHYCKKRDFLIGFANAYIFNH